uniref:Uncharacterized protein n=1 Tax=Rhizophora mucronata TaxID=61149 RepID=A0A2P2PU87_RHIMU
MVVIFVVSVRKLMCEEMLIDSSNL